MNFNKHDCKIYPDFQFRFSKLVYTSKKVNFFKNQLLPAQPVQQAYGKKHPAASYLKPYRMKSFTLSLPEPCTEKWNSFTPTATGGFCSKCQKNVIDFTKATDDEIIQFITKKSPEGACGKFRGDQLKTYFIQPPQPVRPGFVLLKAGIISLLLLVISKPGTAQTSPTKTKTEIVRQQRIPENDSSTTKIRVRGVVTSEEDDSPLPGVNVVQKGTSNGTQTDGDGRFELLVDIAQSSTITFSFISLKTVDYVLRKETQDIAIVMSNDTMGYFSDIVITGAVSHDALYAEKQPVVRRAWTKFKSIF